MSTIGITHHNECIYNVDRTPSGPAMVNAGSESCLYISKFRPKVLKDEKKGKECHKTFGFATVPLPKPKDFLRKNCRIIPPRPVTEKPKCCLTCRRPSLPSCPVVRSVPKPDQTKVWEEGWKKGKGRRYPCPCDKSSREKNTNKDYQICVWGKNFKEENILKAVRSIPRQPQPKYIDTRKGHSNPLLPSGLLPVYIHKKDYGKVPKYIMCRKEAIQSSEMPSTQVKPVAHTIPEDERRELLEGLKQNWSELQKAFQMLPIQTDTLHKRLRKERLEKELRQLEHDIRTIERHEYIYIVDDNAIQ